MTVESGQALKKHLFRVQLCPLFPGGQWRRIGAGCLHPRGPEYGLDHTKTGKGSLHVRNWVAALERP